MYVQFKEYTPRYLLLSLQNRTLPAPGKPVHVSLKHPPPTASQTVCFSFPCFIVLLLVMYPQTIYGGLWTDVLIQVLFSFKQCQSWYKHVLVLSPSPEPSIYTLRVRILCTCVRARACVHACVCRGNQLYSEASY